MSEIYFDCYYNYQNEILLDYLKLTKSIFFTVKLMVMSVVGIFYFIPIIEDENLWVDVCMKADVENLLS